MKLKVELVVPADFEAAKAFYGPELGTLTSPAVLAGWPLTPQDSLAVHKRRNEWSCQQQREILENDPTARFVKTIDLDKAGEIVALARWQECPVGYRRLGDLELVGLKDRNDPATWPGGMNRGFFLDLLDPLYSSRREWQGGGHCWVLTTLVTREPLRRHGAGSMLVAWGVERAKKAGVPAFVEASRVAKGIYEKQGFREIEVKKVDSYGLQFEFSRMRAEP